MSVNKQADPNILFGAKAWLKVRLSASGAVGFEYGESSGHNGTTDTDPENGYLEIDCAWTVKRGLDNAGYAWIPEGILRDDRVYPKYFYRLNPAKDQISAGDIITMNSTKNPTRAGHVGIIETFSENSLGGYDGYFFHSSYSGVPQPIIPNGGSFWWKYGPGPHDGHFIDYPSWMNKVAADLIDGYSYQFITDYWRPRDIPTPGPDEEEEEGGVANYRDPLILNLDGAGIQTLGLDQEIYFDHDANGFQELSGWVSSGSAMHYSSCLYRDKAVDKPMAEERA